MSSSQPQQFFAYKKPTKHAVIKKPAKKNYAWHAHDGREVLATLNASEEGLDQKEVHRRRVRFGVNAFTEHKEKTLLTILFDQLKSPLTIVLIFACGLTVFLQEYIDSIVIFIALAIAVIVGILQEEKASKAFKRLADQQVHTGTVIRGGQKHQIEARDLVPGDIVELEAGMYVPADVRLLHAKLLSVNESSLTGEWAAVDKQAEAVPVGTPFAEQASMVWMGTYVAEGYGTGVVVETGDKTAVGVLADGIGSVVEEVTPLQREMQRVSRIMLYIIVTLVSLIVVIGLYEGHEATEMIKMAVAIAVASVPEGLPAAVTIVLAVGMEVLLGRGGLVRNMLAAETLGSTTYVLTDKTGTLTEATMSITGAIYDRTTNLAPRKWGEEAHTRELLDVALCASNAFEDFDAHDSEKKKGSLREGKKDEPILRGDPVEKAILLAAKHIDIQAATKSLRAARLDYMGFTSENRFAAGLSPVEERYRLSINGAPEYVLENATHIHGKNGVRKLTTEESKEILREMEKHTKEGKRLVGVAYKNVTYDDIPEDEDPNQLIKENTFLGILIFSDPVRDGVREAISGVKEAGAEVVLITGDNEETALSIAKKVGIAGEHDVAFTGTDLEELSDEEVLGVLENVHVFARVLPQQKLRIAQILQRSGEIVAMTGDGINDAPALRKAHIGIAIGSGTEVAKDASDLVLINDTFATIYAAIEDGRRIIANLRKIVGYLLSTSLSEVVLITAALLVGAPVPILPVQILWANIIEEGLMSVAFAFERGEKDAMQRSPRDIHEEGILSKSMLYFLMMVSVVLSSLTLGLYFYLRTLDLDIDVLRSAMFISVAADSLFIAFAFRSLSTPIWKIPLAGNLFFMGSFLVSIVLLVGALMTPFMREVLSYEPLPWSLIGLVIGFSFVGLLVVETAKAIFFEGKNK